MNTHAFFASAARNVSRAGASAILSMGAYSTMAVAAFIGALTGESGAAPPR